MKLKDKVAVVPGGSSGIGKATCKLFAREGAKVVVAARTQPRLSETFKEIRQLGEAIAVEADVRSEQDVKRLFDTAIQTYGKVDILVVTTTFGFVGGAMSPVAEMSLEDWNAVFATTMVGTFLCCREAVKYMIPARKGAIVTFSSTAAEVGNENRSAHSAAKAGIISFTRALAREVGRYNIRVNCIAPGPVLTELLVRGFTALAAQQGTTVEKIKEWRLTASALQRFATPEEAAAEVLFLVSDDSSAMTGQTIDISCGIAMR